MTGPQVFALDKPLYELGGITPVVELAKTVFPKYWWEPLRWSTTHVEKGRLQRQVAARRPTDCVLTFTVTSWWGRAFTLEVVEPTWGVWKVHYWAGSTRVALPEAVFGTILMLLPQFGFDVRLRRVAG